MVDFAVVGGGIAGRCVASLAEANLYDVGGPKASDVFAALCHPFPGRSFQIRPEQVTAWQTTLRWTSNYAQHVQEVEIWRAADGRLSKSAVGAPDLGQRVVGPQAHYRGIVMDMRSWIATLPVHGEHITTEVRVEPDDRCVRLHGTFGTRTYQRVVVCPGARLGAFLTVADVRGFHGHILEIRGGRDVASFGAAHTYPSLRGTTAVGHTFSPQARPLEEVTDELRQRATLDGHDLGETVQVWSGVRAVVHPDRWPVLTEIHPRVAVLGGLGAKGALFAPMLAEYAAAWLAGDALPDAFRYPRLTREPAAVTLGRSR